MTIQEDLQKYLDKPDSKIVHHGSYSTQDFKGLNEVLNSTDRDFLIYDNAGGREFFVLFDCKELIDYFFNNEDFKWRIFSYQLAKKQTILKPLSQ